MKVWQEGNKTGGDLPMDSFSGLLFPTTYLKQDTARRLALVFPSLTCLTPTEDPELSPCTGRFADTPEVRCITPVPLGDEDLGRFKRFLKDMEEWARQVGVGTDLSAQTLISALQLDKAESMQELICTIKGKGEEDVVLTARLFLQLALEFDRKEDELGVELEEVSRKTDMLSALVGVESRAAASSDQVQYVRPLDRPKERLKAWAILASRYTGEDLGCLPVGESVSVKDLMDEAYGGIEKVQPEELLNLSLAMKGRDAAPPLRDSRLGDLWDSLLRAILKAASAESADAIRGIAGELQEAWDGMVGKASNGPVMNLTLYKGRPLEEVVQRAAGMQVPPGFKGLWPTGLEAAFFLL